MEVLGFPIPDEMQAPDYSQEYISGRGTNFPTNVPEVLPNSIDDISRELRYDIYDEMLKDYQVKLAFGIKKIGILGGGMRVLPATDTGSPTYDLDVQVAEFVRACLFDHLKTPIMEVVHNQLDCMCLGYKIAEKVCYKTEQSPIPGKLVYERIKVKKRNTAHFVVDGYLNVIGIISYNSLGKNGPINVLPREKFSVFTWMPVDSDPRGSSDGRAAYEPWWYKKQIEPEYLRFITLYAMPKTVGTLAEQTMKRPKLDPVTMQPVTDTNGIVYDDPATKMGAALEGLKSASWVVVPFGAKIDTMGMSGNGEVYTIAINHHDTGILRSILYQTLANEEGSSGAAATTHENTLSNVIDYNIQITENFIEQEYFRSLVEWNFPVRTRIPRCNLPGAKRAEFLAWASAIAKLQQFGYIDPSQYPGFDNMINAPKRSDEGLAEAIAAKTKEREMIGQMPPTPKSPAVDNNTGE